MRGTLVLALLLVPAFAGCLDAETLFTGGGLRNCQEPVEFTLYLGPSLQLQEELPDNGVTPGNGFNEAFLSNDLDEWHGPFSDRTWRIEGDVELEFWTRTVDTVAPVMIGGEAGDGYHFFNQFGSNRGFVESYAIEYESALPDSRVRHYYESFAMPEGGILIESGDYLRLLLTNLVLDDTESGNGPEILWGPDTPSHISYSATCEDTPHWATLDRDAIDVVVPAHQGLLTGAVPAQEAVNYADVPFALDPDTDRLTIQLIADRDASPKNDMDLQIIGPTGDDNWGIGSPYTDEIGTRWNANMENNMPSGTYTIRVNSYSGHAYTGQVIVHQEVRV